MGRLILRLFIGGMFIGHGMQKLRGWFGGSGPKGTAAMMKSLELYPPERNAMMAGATEAGAGALLAAGLATPVAATGLIATMLTAIRTQHWKNGFWNYKGGWEFNGTLIAALFALAESGPGPASIDAAFGRSRGGVRLALAVLAAAAIGSSAVVAMGRSATRASAAMNEATEPDSSEEPDKPAE